MKNFSHSKCANITIKQYGKLDSWKCNRCIENILPFSKLDNEQFKLTLQGKDISYGEHVRLSPSFSIQSLLDKISGLSQQSNEDFLSNSISSKYYTPSEFLSSKLEKTNFGIIHLNIASLSLHIDGLKMLLNLLDHRWDVIGISETKIREGHEPLTNVSIDGYDFIQTGTQSTFGDVGLFIKSGFDYKVRKDLNKSIQNVSESVFVEIKNKRNKSLRYISCGHSHKNRKIGK